MTVSWTDAAETSGLITSSTVTATPVKPGPPVLTTTAEGNWSSAFLGPVSPNTAYRVTVTNTDAEGTSSAGTVEETSPNQDGEGGGTEGGGEGGTPANEICEQSSGTIKLSPGLTGTPHVQNVTVKGALKGCDGSAEFTEGTYVAHFKTTEEVTCSTLSNISSEPTTTPVSLVVKWAPKNLASSHGALLMAVSEVPGLPLEGALEGGPLSEPLAITAGTVTESYSGGPTCGVPSGKKPAKAVKNGVFSGSAVGLG